PEDIASLEHLVSGGRNMLSKSPHSFPKADLDFHIAVAGASHNKLLPRLLSDIRGVLGEWIQKSQELPGLRENAQRQHERIFDRIANRDPAGARDEMRAHLETFQRAYTLLGRMSDSTSGAHETHAGEGSLVEGA
ncbi:MAG: FadR/GntR family transcriptional regulator, partial [Candidatus Acidiferrales bacterium]